MRPRPHVTSRPGCLPCACGEGKGQWGRGKRLPKGELQPPTCSLQPQFQPSAAEHPELRVPRGVPAVLAGTGSEEPRGSWWLWCPAGSTAAPGTAGRATLILALHVPGVLPSLTNHLSYLFLPLAWVVNLLLLINL